MACPLSAILNDEPTSPLRSTPLYSSQDSAQLRTPINLRNSDVLQSQGHTQSATYGMLPPFQLSPSKGSLYNRRARISPTRVPQLPTPPKSGVPMYWFDGDPPSHEMDFNQFSVFTEITKIPELTFELVKHLPVEDLISLYAISKDFHFILNGHYTTVIRSQARIHAAESSEVFHYKCYKSLCIIDPAARKNVEVPEHLRCVPSFRWLRFVIYREGVVDEIIGHLAVEGHRLPKRATSVLKKIWFLLDLGDNARRIGLIHNRTFWKSQDLFAATMFFIKLDMRFTDPVDGNGEMSLRKLLLAQRSLSTMLGVLRRTEIVNELELLQMYVRWKYRPAPEHQGMSIVGVPAEKVGKGHLEGWGLGRKTLLRPDELVMREAIRRKLDLHKRYMDMMIWGYVNSKTLENIPTNQMVTDNQTTESSSEDDFTEESEDDGDGNGEAIDQADIVVA